MSKWTARPGNPTGPEAGASDFRGLSFDRLPGSVGTHRTPLLTAKSGFQELLEAGDTRGGAAGTIPAVRPARHRAHEDEWHSTVLDDTLLPM